MRRTSPGKGPPDHRFCILRVDPRPHSCRCSGSRPPVSPETGYGTPNGKEPFVKRYARLGLAGLLTTVALLVASCGGAGGGMGNMQEGQMDGEGRQAKEGKKGMDHSKMEGGRDGGAQKMVMEDGKYSDRRFIDAMVPHHEGAVEMAEVALENAEHDEIRRLARDIVSTQRAEIQHLRSIKREEFGTSEVPTGMSADQMQGMGMMTDPRSLAEKDPFDKAFIDNMIPHHRSAIEMAELAAKETRNPKIKALATDIVEAQEREISQMKRWRQEWYPQA